MQLSTDDRGHRAERLLRRRSSCCSSRRGCRASTARSSAPRATSARTRSSGCATSCLPLLAPAIFAGALFAFTLSLDEFIITLFLIGSHNTLPIYIYTQVKFGITPEVNALAALLLAASLCLIAFAFVLPGIVRRGAPSRAPARGLGVDRNPATVARAAERRGEDLHAAVTVD